MNEQNNTWRDMTDPGWREREAAQHAQLLAMIPERQSASDADLVLLRKIFALCEATENECADSDDNFKRGRAFEAKHLRRAIGTWYQDEHCGRSFMGEPVLTPNVKFSGDQRESAGMQGSGSANV